MDLVRMELLALILTSVQPRFAKRKVQFMFLSISVKDMDFHIFCY